MKEMMLQMMVMMMPAMKPMVYIGGLFMVLGVVLILARMFMPSPGVRSGIIWSGRILLFLGIFFIVCQFMGIWLGATPSINFGDPKKFEFNMYPFWQIGAVFFVVAIILGFLSGRGSTQTT